MIPQVYVPKFVFFTKGIGRHKAKLQSFELALRAAKIEKCNLVKVSSIFPPKCKIISRKRGSDMLIPGQITFCVMSENYTNENGRVLGSAIGLAVPAAEEQYGYISEYHAFGETKEEIADTAEDLASSMLASTLGVDFNPELDYDERKEIYRISGKIVESQSSVCVTQGRKNVWTTVVTAAVFI